MLPRRRLHGVAATVRLVQRFRVECRDAGVEERRSPLQRRPGVAARHDLGREGVERVLQREVHAARGDLDSGRTRCRISARVERQQRRNARLTTFTISRCAMRCARNCDSQIEICVFVTAL